MARANNGPYIPEKPNAAGVWEIKWSDKGRSRRRSTGEKDLGQARKILAKFIVGFETDEEKRPNQILVSAALAAYWNEHVRSRVISQETLFYHLRHLARHFACYDADGVFDKDDPDVAQGYIDGLSLHTGGYTIVELTDIDVENYCRKRVAGKIGRRASDGTLRREIGCLNAAFNHALRAKRISHDDRFVGKMPPPPAPKDRWLTQEEQVALLEAAQNGETRLTRVYRFVAIALATASRKTAIERLEWQQIDLAAGLLQLNPSGRAQTKKRRPVVPISPWLKEILVRAEREATSVYVLDEPTGMKRWFALAAERAGLPGVTPHTLRHTWATQAARRGVSLWEIAGVLGDTVETVTKRYLHHCPEHLRSAVDYDPTQPPAGK